MTIEAIDYRRYDQRRYIYQPYWITSAEIYGPDCDDLGAILFVFPARQYSDSIIIIEKIGFQVVKIFAGGTITIDIGYGTIATEDITTGDDIDIGDLDEYIPNADITEGTAGFYPALTGDWITAKLLMTETSPCRIVPADTDVPVIYATIESDDTITAGYGRVHALITEVPLYPTVT